MRDKILVVIMDSLKEKEVRCEALLWIRIGL